MQVARDNPHAYIKDNLAGFGQKNLQSLMLMVASNWVREWRQGRDVEDINVNNINVNNIKFCPCDGPCRE